MKMVQMPADVTDICRTRRRRRSRMRLDKFLAAAGVGSRSDVKKVIAGGDIKVNGIVCKDPSRHIDEGNDSVSRGGQPITFSRYVYFMLNKPQGVISASRSGSSSAERTCVDLIEEEAHRELFPVGRLDKDTEGLLLITDDGQLAHELLSPKKHVDKVYYAKLERALSEADRERLEAGLDIGDPQPTLPARVRMIDSSRLEITIHEGRYHQIKRMLEAVGNRVTYLKRLQMGSLKLDGSLNPGEYRALTCEELENLNKNRVRH